VSGHGFTEGLTRNCNGRVISAGHVTSDIITMVEKWYHSCLIFHHS